MNGTLAIIAKSPVPGRVKTRLCPPCTPEEAAALAEAALIDTLTAARVLTDSRVVVALDGEPGSWLPAGVDVVPQRGADLSRRLANLFDDLSRHGAGPMFVVAMDTPQVTGLQLRAGLDALADHGLSLGPTEDGGYWGIGLAAANPSVFDGVPMSASNTAHVQQRRAAALGLSTALLPVLRDVDAIADVRAVASAAPCTRFAVVAHGLGLTEPGDPAHRTVAG